MQSRDPTGSSYPSTTQEFTTSRKGRRESRVHPKRFVNEALSNVDSGRGEVLYVRIAVAEQGIRLATDLVVEFGPRDHVVNREAERVAEIHAQLRRYRQSETQVRLRHQLRIARVQAQQVTHEVPLASGPLCERLVVPDPLKHLFDEFPPTFHARGLQREFGQDPQDMNGERSLIVNYQVVDQIL